MGARVRRTEGKGTDFAHTLNGSGVAVGQGDGGASGEPSARRRVDWHTSRIAALPWRPD